MNIQYDKVADALYVKLSGGKVSKTVEISEHLIADLDQDGKTIGIEILDVSSDASIEEALQKNLSAGMPIEIREEAPVLQ
jgi:uncharacterized protein YuzE